MLNESTLICTLGGKPQVVTFALDWLLARGETVRDLYVIHLSQTDPRIADSLARLQAEFVGEKYRDQPIRFHTVPLRDNHDPLPRIRTEAEADITRDAVFSLIADLKQARRTLHLVIAGGPRMMGLMALSAATIHCRHQDKVWHMYTHPDFMKKAEADKLLHDPTDGNLVHLIEVPIVPWGAYFPTVPNATTPAAALQAKLAGWTKLNVVAVSRCGTT